MHGAPVDRRVAMRGAVGAGVAVAGLGALANCSTSDGETTATITGEGGRIPASKVPVGGGAVLADVDAVITQPVAGEFHGFSATCTHQGCRVTSVSEGLIRCPCHGSTFDAATGEVRSGPAPTALPARKVTRSGDTLTVE